MVFRNWFRPKSTLRNRPHTVRPVIRLRVHALEDRTTPSAGALDPTFGTGGVALIPTDTYSTQPVTAAHALDVTQAYLSMLEKGYRPLSEPIRT